MGYLAIQQKYDKLIVSIRTAQAKEYSLDKDQTSYDDLLDALR
jgi:competence protein ComGC